MTPAAIARFAQKTAAHRQTAFGQTPIRYRTKPLCVPGTTVTRREQLEDGGFALDVDAIIRLREILGHNSTTGPGPAALAALNATPGLGCSCYTVEAPTTEARDAQKRQHGLASPWRFWIHRR
jgi:hypothetical protein